MYGIRKAVGSTAVGCALCLGAVVPMTLSSTVANAAVHDVINNLTDTGVISDAVPDPNPVDSARDWLARQDPRADSTTILIVTPGTDDGTLYPRIAGMRGGRDDTYIVNYPQSLGPIISGPGGPLLPFFAPSYDKSRDIAVANNVAVMKAFADANAGSYVVYTGYSQGAEALGNAAEQAVGSGSIDTANSHVILVSDPRSPWGMKAWAADNPLVGVLLEVFGAKSNGARDPKQTGALQVTSVIVVGDPVSNFQWVWYRPVSSLLVDAAGFITIHSGMGKDNYGNLVDYGDPTTLKSEDGNTTYLVYQAKHHPLTMLAMMVSDALGMKYSGADLARLDKVNTAFYPLQQPTVAKARVGVEDPHATPSASRPETTVPQPQSTVADSSHTSTGQVSEPTGGRHRAPETDTAPTTPAPHPAENPTPSTGSETTGSETTGSGTTGSGTTGSGTTDSPTPGSGSATSATPGADSTGADSTEPAGTGEQRQAPTSPVTQQESTGGRHRLQGSGRHSADDGTDAAATPAA